MKHHQVLVHVHKDLFFVLTAILLILTFGGAARLGAQSLAGSLTGLITDPSGAVVVGADAVLTDVDKGYTYTSVSNAEGRYIVRDLSPGNYKLKVKKEGFESFSLSGILIEVNENTSRNVQLTVGNASETVNVTTEEPLLQTQDATLGVVIDRQFVNEMPLIGRDVLSLTYLTPGVTQPQGGMMQASGGNEGNDLNFVSDGQRNATAAMFVDGVVTSQGDQNPGVVRNLYIPSPDATLEFKVEQGIIRADSGFSGGTSVNIVTRSGSNQFHGTVYDFDQNNSFNANSWNNNLYGVKNQPSNTSIFGGVIGGPIKKDKTFFFAVFDGNRSHYGSSSLSWVPSKDERAGNFAEICQLGFGVNGQCLDSNPNTNFGQIWDPYTASTLNSSGDVIAQNFIPYNNMATYVSPGPNPLEDGPITLPSGTGNIIDPSAKIIMNTAFPTANIPSAGVNDANYLSVTHGTGASNEIDLRLDQRFTATDNLVVKFSYLWANSDAAGCLPGIWDPCSNGPNTSKTYHAALNYSRALNSHTLLLIQGGVLSSHTISPGVVASEDPSFDPVADLGMASYMDFSSYRAAPYIGLAGNGVGAIGSKTWSIWNLTWSTWQLGGSLDITKGKHEFKFGGDWRFLTMGQLEPGAPAGSFSFSNVGTAQDQSSGTGGGNTLASLMIGSPLNYPYYSDYVQTNTSNPDYDVFVQDTWRILPKLTLDLGLRYEIQVPETEANNDNQWFDPNAPSPYASYLPGLKGAVDFAGQMGGERRAIDTSFNNIEPRFGFAYQINNKTVVRGGYGIYFAPSVGTAGGGTSGSSPASHAYGYASEYLYNGIAGSDGATPAARFSNPFPGGFIVPPIDDPSALSFAGIGSMDISVRNPNVPYVQTFTLGVQRDLPSKSVLTLFYVGTKGTHLYNMNDSSINQLPISVESDTPAQLANINNNSSPNPFYNAPTAQGCAGGNYFCSAQAPNYDLDVPFPQYPWMWTNNAPYGSSTYHSFQATFQKRLTHGLEGHVAYTWSKSIDDGSSGTGNSSYYSGPGDYTFLDPNRPYLERSLSGFDVPQNLTLAYTYALPFGRGRDFGGSVNSLVDAVLGGWNTSGMWAFQSGFPTQLEQQNGTPIPTYYLVPTIHGVLKKNSSFKKPGDNYFESDWNTIVTPSPDYSVPSSTVENVPRYDGSVRAPGINIATLGVFKSFNLSALREGARFEFRVEAFNALNHPQFAAPVSRIDSGNFGAVYPWLTSAPRRVQFGGKIYF